MDANETLIVDFLRFKEIVQNRSKHTVAAYRLRLNELVDYLKSHKKNILSADPDDLFGFCGLYLHTKGVAPRSRRPTVAVVRGFYKWLHHKRLINKNTAQHLEYPKISKKLPFPLSLSQAEALFMQPDLGTLRGCRDAAILSVLFGTGLRVGGLVNLNTEDIVLNQDADGKDLSFIRVSMKGGDERLLPLPLETLLFIRIYLGHPDFQNIDRILPDGNSVLFVSLRNSAVSVDQYYGENRRLSSGAIRRMFQRYGEKAGIPQNLLHPHAMRHLFGTELAEAGIDIHVRKELMGHKSLESTLLYDRLSMRRLTAASESANPFSRIKTPITDLAIEFRKKGISGGV